ncbi:MAG: hypothetical protein R3E39_31685 [Anaerolineae bacterium]
MNAHLFEDAILDNIVQRGNPPVLLLAAFNDMFPDQVVEWLTCAPGRDMWVAAASSPSAEFTVYSPEQDGKVTFSLQSAKSKITVLRRPLPRWARYPAGVALILAQDGLDVTGLNIVMMGNEPPGPRFDYGMGMTFAALWHDLHQLPYTADGLIEIVDRVRRDYVEEG